MKISAKTYYGLRALAFLSLHPGTRSIADLSRSEGIPEKYLEKILQKLKRDGLVESKKGASGGYSLKKDSDGITMADIFLSLEGPIVTAPCFSSVSGCEKSGTCSSRRFWKHLDTMLTRQLEMITLGTILAEEKKISGQDPVRPR